MLESYAPFDIIIISIYLVENSICSCYGIVKAMIRSIAFDFKGGEGREWRVKVFAQVVEIILKH